MKKNKKQLQKKKRRKLSQSQKRHDFFKLHQEREYQKQHEELLATDIIVNFASYQFDSNQQHTQPLIAKLNRKNNQLIFEVETYQRNIDLLTDIKSIRVEFDKNTVITLNDHSKFTLFHDEEINDYSELMYRFIRPLYTHLQTLHKDRVKIKKPFLESRICFYIMTFISVAITLFGLYVVGDKDAPPIISLAIVVQGYLLWEIGKAVLYIYKDKVITFVVDKK